nr:hypothetical protein [uncultured Methanoregula sp.]
MYPLSPFEALLRVRASVVSQPVVLIFPLAMRTTGPDCTEM